MPRYVNCNLCGENNTKIVQEAEELFKVVKCKKCGLVYTNPQPERETIDSHYQEEYYKEWIEKQMKRRVLMWKRRLKDLMAYKKNGRLLDVGCGLGTFLKLAEKEGFFIFGTEVSKYASRFVKESSGIDVFNGDLKGAYFPSSHFDVVTVWHTLEHMPDPKVALKEVNRILKRDGLLVIAVPNLNNYITRILYILAKGRKLKLFSIYAKEWHLYHFTSRTITSMLEATGFSIMKLDMDLSQINFPLKIVDILTAVFHFITRRNYGEALKIYSVKTQ